MFAYNLIRESGDVLLAISDKDLIGQKLQDGKVKIEISNSFYGGETAEEGEVEDLASRSTIINAVGNEIISLLIEKEFIDKERVIEIDGVKHAQMVRI